MSHTWVPCIFLASFYQIEWKFFKKKIFTENLQVSFIIPNTQKWNVIFSCFLVLNFSNRAETLALRILLFNVSNCGQHWLCYFLSFPSLYFLEKFNSEVVIHNVGRSYPVNWNKLKWLVVGKADWSLFFSHFCSYSQSDYSQVNICQLSPRISAD